MAYAQSVLERVVLKLTKLTPTKTKQNKAYATIVFISPVHTKVVSYLDTTDWANLPQ